MKINPSPDRHIGTDVPMPTEKMVKPRRQVAVLKSADLKKHNSSRNRQDLRGYYSASSAMKYLDISKTTFYDLLKEGIVPDPQITLGKRLKRWSRAQLDAVGSDQSNPPTST